MWDFAPKVNGFLTHQQSNFDNDAFNMFNYNSYWIPSTVMGLSVSMPVFTSFANKMRLDQARIDLIEVQEAKDQIGQALTLEYEQAKSAYSYASDRLSNEQRNREITKSIRDKTLIKYKEGISSSLEVTQTQNQYLNSETNYLSAMLELLNAKSRLDKVLGNYNKQ
jgi:outer membrane protein TolC